MTAVRGRSKQFRRRQSAISLYHWRASQADNFAVSAHDRGVYLRAVGDPGHLSSPRMVHREYGMGHCVRS
jgi:hypothetical protein